LESLNELQQTRLSLIEHEIQLLRHNNEQDKRLEMLEENIQGTKQVIKAIRNQLEIVNIVVPKIKEGEAIVMGE
jgi:hypothetical protein